MCQREGRRAYEKNGVPLVVTDTPNFKNLSFLIRTNLQFLYADAETKRVFRPASFASLRSVRNLKIFLVRSKVYPLERKVGSAKCNGKRCQVCLNINETNSFNVFKPNKNTR